MFKLFKLFGPPETGGPSGIVTPMDKDDVIKFLGSGDDEPETIDLDPPKTVKAKEVEEESEDSEKEENTEEEDEDDEVEKSLEEELEEDLEEATEEKLELVTPVRRSEILKKYPKLFKDFPYLEKAYYREQKFTEMFPTMEDAQESQAKASTLDRFEVDLLEGKSETIFSGVKKASERAFAQMMDNLMPTLAKVDEKAYHHVLGNVFKEAIIGMTKEGRAQKNDALQNAAAILNQYVFGTTTFEPPKKLDIGEEKGNPERENLDRERREFAESKFADAKSAVDGKVQNALKTTIEGNIDTKDEMTPYVKRIAIREASEEIKSLIERDTRFKVIIDKLWDRARKGGMKPESVNEIKSTYLTKAKQLLPSVIKKARTDALKGMGKRTRNNNDEDEVDTPPRNPKRRATNDDSEQPRSRNSGKSSEIPKGMSTLEFLTQGD